MLSSHDAYDVPTFEPLAPSTHPTARPISALYDAIVHYVPRHLPKQSRRYPCLEETVDELEPATPLDAVRADKIAADFWRLIAYQQHRTHDTELSEHLPDQNNRGVFVNTVADGERYGLRLNGRTMEAMLSRGDLLTKLTRREAHLARQIRQALEDLRQSKKNRHERSVGFESAERESGDRRNRLLDM